MTSAGIEQLNASSRILAKEVSFDLISKRKERYFIETILYFLKKKVVPSCGWVWRNPSFSYLIKRKSWNWIQITKFFRLQLWRKTVTLIHARFARYHKSRDVVLLGFSKKKKKNCGFVYFRTFECTFVTFPSKLLKNVLKLKNKIKLKFLIHLQIFLWRQKIYHQQLIYVKIIVICWIFHL